MNRLFLDTELEKIISKIKTFSKDSKSLDYHLISSIDISKFPVPIIDNFGNFKDGPRAQRDVYEHVIQNNLRDVSNRRNPCIYIFEVISNTPSKTIIEEYKKYTALQKSIKINRKCSAIKSSRTDGFQDDISSKILYVGKSEKPLDGRIVVHFGYYEKQVAGLQLIYWAKEIGLHLNLHVFEVTDRKYHDFLSVMEQLFFLQLKPLIGVR